MPYYILRLYINTFCDSLVVENSVGCNPLRGSFVSFIPREENSGERALVALSPTLESLVLVCTAISPSNPHHPCRLVQAAGGSHSFFVTCHRKSGVLLDP